LCNARVGTEAAGKTADDLTLVVLDRDDHVVWPSTDVPGWTPEDELTRLVAASPSPSIEPTALAHDDLFAAVAPVGDTGMQLVLFGNERNATAPVRRRFLVQLLVLISLQISAVVMLSAFAQRTYRRVAAMERQAVAQEQLVALGGAASLIA